MISECNSDILYSIATFFHPTEFRILEIFPEYIGLDKRIFKFYYHTYYSDNEYLLVLRNPSNRYTHRQLVTEFFSVINNAETLEQKLLYACSYRSEKYLQGLLENIDVVETDKDNINLVLERYKRTFQGGVMENDGILTIRELLKQCLLKHHQSIPQLEQQVECRIRAAGW